MQHINKSWNSSINRKEKQNFLPIQMNTEIQLWLNESWKWKSSRLNKN